MNARTRLRGAMVAAGWSVDRLRCESGIDCSRPSLHRKIFGTRKRRSREVVYQPLTVEEYQILARPLEKFLRDMKLDVGLE